MGLLPSKPSYLEQTISVNPELMANINCIDAICMEPQSKKQNIRRLSMIYSLISMFRDNINQTSQWDFVRLMLLTLIILENEPNKYRTQMLPQIDIAEKGMNENIKSTQKKPEVESSWLDLDDSVDDDLDDFDDEEEGQDDGE